MNKDSIPSTVPKQSRAAVPVAEIHNVDVPILGLVTETLLSPTTSTLSSGPCAIMVNFEISFPVAERKLKWQTTNNKAALSLVNSYCLLSRRQYWIWMIAVLIKEVICFVMFQCITFKAFIYLFVFFIIMSLDLA